MFPKLLDRYVGEEVALYTVGFYFAFLMFMMGNDFFLLLQMIQDKQIPAAVVARMIMLHSTWYMSWGLPAAVLFGVLVGIGRMANDNEITAMKTSGISLRRVQRPVFFIGILASFGVWWIGEKLAPPALREYAEIYVKYGISTKIENIQPQRFLKGNENQFFYFNRVDFDKQQVFNAFLIQLDESMSRPKTTATAQAGDIEGDNLTLHTGVRTTYGPNGYTESSGPYDSMEIDVGRDIIQNISVPQVPAFMPIGELARDRRTKRLGGYTDKQLAPEDTEYYFKYSLPFAAFVFAFMAFPLAARASRGGRFMSLFFALFFYSFYYVMISASKLLGYNQILPPIIAGWMTTGTLILISIALLIRGER